MMNHMIIGMNVWVDRWISGGMWVWTLTAIIILLAVIITWMMKK